MWLHYLGAVMKRIVEIRSAEGGEDAKLFSKDLAAAYMKHFTRVGWKHRLIDTRDGEISIEVIGESLLELNNERGGHRIQRVPPTERKGRVHTSTVTVAVIDPLTIQEVVFNARDFKVEWYSGTGNGGQNKNKVQACCRLIHIKTGIIQTAQTRSRENSFKLAKQQMLFLLTEKAKETQHAKESKDRKSQIGSGMRGDKIRTYRFQDNSVKDHRTEKSARADIVLNGNFDLLW